MERTLQLRITLVKPPAGVQFCLQRGKAELVDAAMSTGEDLSFTLDVRAQPAGDGGVRLLGPFTQGPPTARFFYIGVGTYAGQLVSPWSRRIKVPLSGITWALAEHGALEAHIAGTGRDGGPACATVPLLDGGWRVWRG
ncbi:MAG: hypothetical protein IT162_13845 [Bryobacterales bacterium]|nr:hypothetical protein [Bryobacterales bacterium]